MWETIKGKISRRGERMVPWRTGLAGSWLISDPIEEIYVDRYLLDQVRIKDLRRI
jgi:hypothetical protein